jgi:hypothetical protein
MLLVETNVVVSNEGEKLGDHRRRETPSAWTKIAPGSLYDTNSYRMCKWDASPPVPYRQGRGRTVEMGEVAESAEATRAGAARVER